MNAMWWRAHLALLSQSLLLNPADARNRDYTVIVPADCVATFDPEAHRFALDHMRRVLGATVEDVARSR